MTRKSSNRMAILASSTSVIAASSLILTQGMGAVRHYILTSVAAICFVALIYLGFTPRHAAKR